MIDFALDPTETRDARSPVAVRGRPRTLRVLAFGLAGLGALGGFGVAATTLMAGLAAPAPIKLATHGRASDWPELKDGLPAVAGATPSTPAAMAAAAAEPVAPVPRMAALPEPVPPSPMPARAASAPTRAAAASEPPTRRIPTPTPAIPLAPARQAVPLPPARMAALQAPRASETVRAREASPQPTKAASAPEKPVRKPTVATVKAPAPVKSADKAKPGVAATIAQAEPAESEETEVLGIKLPSLAPAGRKIKESVDALGDAVRKVF